MKGYISYQYRIYKVDVVDALGNLVSRRRFKDWATAIVFCQMQGCVSCVKE